MCALLCCSAMSCGAISIVRQCPFLHFQATLTDSAPYADGRITIFLKLACYLFFYVRLMLN